MKAIGIDIGGSKISGALVDRTGKIETQISVNTNRMQRRDELIDCLFNIISQLIGSEKDRGSIKGIGIGSAGRIDHINGVVTRPAVNLPEWEGLTLKKLVEDQFNLPAFLGNDANVAALGEGWIGAAKGLKDYIMITLGTGVGAGIVINGKLFYGSRWNGGEIGHIPLYPEGEKCPCGLRGCVEQYISGKALVKKANLVRAPHQELYKHGHDIFNDYLNGLEEIDAVVHQFITDLTYVLTTIQNSFDPEMIVIGGGVIGSKDLWWSLLEKKISQLPIPIQVVPARLDNRAGVIGAASIVFKHNIQIHTNV